MKRGLPDVRLVTEQAAASEHFHREDVGDVVMTTRKSPAKESVNEDSALIARLGRGRLVLAVADGVGGHAAGSVASRLAVEALAAALEGMPEKGALREAVLDGIDRANAAVCALASGAATTIAVAVIEDGVVRAYHVGDSHIVAFGGRGKVKLETIPHSPTGFAVEAGWLEPEEAFTHEERHLVSNVVGSSDMHIAISPPLRLQPRDTVVVASDGLFDNLSTGEVVEHARRGPVETAAETLARLCASSMAGGGHPDDLTFCVYRPGKRS